MINLSDIVKAYDVRGTVPDQLNTEVARALGAAFVVVTGATRLAAAHDMRTSGPELLAAFAEGATSQGADVVNVGLASTDLLYFASGHLGLPGAMFTASHNPARYNGIKLCRAGAVPIGRESGLVDVRVTAQGFLDNGLPAPVADPGSVSEQHLLAEYARYLRRLVDLSGIRPLKVAVDAGNGMGGYTVPAVLGDGELSALPLEIVPLYFELDGSFPNHEANPLEPANLVDLQRKVVEVGADIGLAFDGDADRCFVVDGAGNAVSPSAVTALVAVRELAKAPGSAVIHNLITSKAVPEIIAEHGGRPVRTRVGHSYIKAEMATTDAVFGGEHSAHYYFRDFWRADTGMLAAMHMLAALGEQDGTLTELTAEYERYAASGEINSTVDDQASRVVAVRRRFADRTSATDALDGLTITLQDGSWLNVRASNTEPLLRLNVEASTPAAMAAIRDEALAVIRS
ncbi:phosphomannomutase/phosphoglucomutase [Jatrophihabitans lederbergiae]|uniref:Phosphomannomutase/phosphoglucomutase n=1 Tax=Jatrophihabitans lederbergiae TaxID=3075547 RepID=A0ABU2J5V2_9ACTN|nr:phosphomannomutase/phosphoglucomutase [Jatrophihabitans sp. DSM 44399]MDT0260367.1 phosphomannomutase/phosphoglucomutase [Jatrophihabitans sp. DSM 44399]